MTNRVGQLWNQACGPSDIHAPQHFKHFAKNSLKIKTNSERAAIFATKKVPRPKKKNFQNVSIGVSKDES